MIHIKHVDKKYSNDQVLFDFSLDIETNKHIIYGLVGPNGAGKTTLLKLLTGILKYSKGEIFVDECEQYDYWSKDNVFLISAGERGLRYKNTVFDNVMYFASLKGIEEQRSKKLLEKFAGVLNFQDFLSRRVETLSMGQKKKAMLLCGLCTDMKVILMDEPSNGLDIDAQIELKEIIKEISEEFNKTFIISSHDLTFISEIADSYVYIFKGENVFETKEKMGIEEIRKMYNHLKTEE